MIKKKYIFIPIAILLFVSIFIFYFNGKNLLYGNDKESIVKVINSIDGYENKSIEILDIIDFNNLRVVAILANNSPGYVQFVKNRDGNYEWKKITVRNNETFANFLLTFPNLPKKFIIVTNRENKIAKMQININGQKIEQEITPNKATFTWFDLPQTDKGKYTFRNYKFYDEDGNLIEEY